MDYKVNILDSVFITKANPDFNFITTISSFEDFVTIDNRPYLIVYNLKENKTSRIFNTKLSFRHYALNNHFLLDTSLKSILGSYTSSYFDGEHSKAFGIYNFNEGKQIQKFNFNNRNFVNKTDTNLKYNFADHIELTLYKPYYNIKEKYCIAALKNFITEEDEKLRPIRNSGNLVKLFSQEGKYPKYFGFKYYSNKKDSFIFFNYYYPCGFSDSNYSYLAYGLNNIIYKINNNTNEITEFNASVSFLPQMHFLEKEYEGQFVEYYIQYTYLHYNPYTDNYYRMVRLPKKRTESIGNYKKPHGIIIMNNKFTPIGFAILPVGCDQIVFTSQGTYIIDQNYTRRNSQIKLYKIDIKNTKKKLKIEPYYNADVDDSSFSKVDSSKFYTYLRTLGCTNKNTKAIIIPLINSCPACIAKIVPILTEAKKDTSVNIIIISNNKQSVDKYMEKSNLKTSRFVFVDIKWQFENYLTSMYNINSVMLSEDKFIIQRYDPGNLYDIIKNLKINSQLTKPGPQCYPIDED